MTTLTKDKYTREELSEVAALMRGKKRSKYGNRKVVMEGVEHASKKQGLRWVLLRQMEREGKITDLRREVTYRLEVNGHAVCKYIADHVYLEEARTIMTPYGPAVSYREVVEDVKSPITRKNRAYRIKCKLMRACHGITIKEV